MSENIHLLPDTTKRPMFILINEILLHAYESDFKETAE